ncbi:endonuclease/exonuclease/phosphatase family protein [Agaribacterium sp. ZY112]|uniref:endonuclease/exonuclease/phosphatase family protein n=1 Tax=Agaribacterium sp. ZY112 TaxID=3233574 RepID=UPI003524C51F
MSKSDHFSIKNRLFDPLKNKVVASLLALISISAPSTAWEYIVEEAPRGQKHSSQDCQAYRSEQSLAKGDLHIGSWNVLKGKRLGWDKVLQKASETSAILLMQEATYGEALHQALELHAQPIFAPGYISAGQQTGVITSATAKPSQSCMYRHYEPWLETPKAALVLYYNIEDRSEQLLVANIHAINFSLGIDAFEQQLDDVMQEIAQHHGPVIFAGDFNTWNQKRMLSLTKSTQKLGLIAAPFEKEKIKSFRGWPLDHIFYRGLELKNSRVIEVDSSDHNFLHAHFRI